MTDAKHLIDALHLSPHPEGGWYRETFRQPAPGGGGSRDLATAILFLIEDGRRSHWHRIDAAELWLWHAGSPLLLGIDDGTRTDHLLGPDVQAGQIPQVLVPAHAWQAAEPQRGWSLVSCVVAPAFDFTGFELAPPGWSPGCDLPQEA